MRVNFFEKELVFLFYYQKLYILMYQYYLLAPSNLMFLSVYNSEECIKKVPSFLEVDINGESYFWEPYTLLGEWEFRKKMGMGSNDKDSKNKNNNFTLWKTEEDNTGKLDEDKQEEDENNSFKKLRKRPEEGELIPAWTVPTWFYYKQKYEIFPLKYDIETYTKSDLILSDSFSTFVHYKEVYTCFFNNLRILSNSFWLLRFLSLYTRHYTQNKVTWIICIPMISKPLQSKEFLSYYKIFLLIPKVYSFLQLLDSEGFCLIYNLLITKNITLFITWISNYLKTLGVKNYKRFLRLLKNFLDSLIIFGLKYNLLHGYQFILRGKLMGGGSTRKKHLIFNTGHFSLSSRKLGFNYKKFIIRTSGGVISGEFRLFF